MKRTVFITGATSGIGMATAKKLAPNYRLILCGRRQDRLDEILTKVNSFNFLSVLTSTTKDKYGKYKDEDNEYSFLYNNYNLQYEELKYKYEELDNINKNIIKQF